MRQRTLHNTTQHPRKFRRHIRTGFTLIEMLVTIGIIIIVLAITFPFIAAMSRLMSGGAGANTVHAAVTAARGYATRNITTVLPGTDYRGAAILFTPSGELRLIENLPSATNSASGAVLETMANDYTGYRDIPDRDYITLPGDTIVLGLARNSTSSMPLVLTPPFAIRFDQNGQVIASVNMATDKVVYYNADYRDGWNVNAGQGTYGDGSARRDPYDLSARNFAYNGNPYDPDYWNFNHAKFQNDVYIDGSVIDPSGDTPGNYAMPFEGIETVAALLIVSRRDVEEAGLDLVASDDDSGASPTPARSGDLNATAKAWVLSLDLDGNYENAEVLNFSRYTGVVIRDDE